MSHQQLPRLRTATLRALAASLVIVAAVWAFLVMTQQEASPIGLIVFVVPAMFLLTVSISSLEDVPHIAWNRDVHVRATPQARSTLTLTGDIERALQGAPVAIAIVAEALWSAAEQKLVVHHGADPDEPFEHAERYLSPGLVTFLADTLVDQRPTRLTRRALDAYIAEIEAL